MKFLPLFLLLIFFISVSCRPEIKKETDTTSEWSKEHSVDYNREVNEREQLDILVFLKQHPALNMDTSSSGLRYMIYKKTEGRKVKSGDNVSVHLKIELLNGTLCYETDSSEQFEYIKVGKSEVESGIQEGLKLMRIGERAKLILPSYLGHGLLGDRFTIPPQSILYIDLIVNEIK